MLIDEFMPEYDFSEKRGIVISAPALKVFEAVKTSDMCESAVIRWLFRLRGLPTEGLTLKDFGRMNFEVLGETQNREILIGLAGKFWTPLGNLQKVTAENFREFDKKGLAKATCNFFLEELDGNKTRLETETRIKATDEKSRSKFGLYWTFIRPFSGWTRTEMLRIIKERAESRGK